MPAEEIFWEDSYLTEFSTRVTSVERDMVTLDRILFFAASGGQESDTGTIGGNGKDPAMAKSSNPIIRIIFFLVLSSLFSCASAQKELNEGKDAEFYNNRGTAYVNEWKFDQAIAEYTRALKINPNYIEAYNNRGVVYRRKGQYDKAIADYNKVLEINPRDADAFNNRGAVYTWKGQYDQAISDYNKALEINPNFAESYYGLGICYYNQKQYEKSWENLQKAKSLGMTISSDLMDDLRRATGREK
jgi:tetratricopeptide (TPR) repeat protein